MRRILLLVTDLKIGGTPTVVRELALRLRSAGGWNVDVACLATWGPVAEQIRDGGVEVTALGAHGPSDLRVVPKLIRLVRTRRIDTLFSFLIHANAMATVAAAIVGGMRCLQSIQTTQPEPRWHWRLQRLIHPAAEKIVVPSKSVAEAAMRWSGIPPGKIVVIPNAVDLRQFGASDAGVQLAGAEHGRAAHATEVPFPIGFIGRLDPIKRVPDLLKAVWLLKGLVHVHIFGEGPARSAIEAEMQRLGIGDRVTMHGAVARPQEALSQIGVLVLPSAAEGFPLVPIEAMAAGVAVVATNVPGIRDAVANERTGLLVPAGSAPALADAIERVVKDAALRAALVQRGRREVEERFSWERVMGEYLKLLDER